MEDYYNTLLKHLDGYTVMGLFNGKRDIQDIVTLQTGNKGRVFFFDQEPMIQGVDNALWDHIFQEPTIFANSELDSADKEYIKYRYPNFIDWYYFANALVSREWFDSQRHQHAGWIDHKQTLLDCNLISGPRQYRIYLIYQMYRMTYQQQSFISFNGEYDWKKDLLKNDQFDLLAKPQKYLNRIPRTKVSYDNWGNNNKFSNNLMQSRLPLEYYSQVNYITVSETLCVENKKHLTEKIFKPIAAGKPFILAGGYKNLEYLRSYGFKTFRYLWNEDYDNIQDPKTRLEKIFDLFEEIGLDRTFLHKEGSVEYINACRNIEKKLSMFEQAHKIAIENRNHFWSNEFYNFLIKEAVENLKISKLELASKRV